MRFIMESRDRKSSSGRPTRVQARARQEALLDTALDMFLDGGFERTTIDAIAAALGMTKRTVYARYADKAALFRASVERAIGRYTISSEAHHAADTGDLEETLTAIAHLRIANIMSREGLRLQRILNAEAPRFPDIFDRFYALAARPTVDFLAALLRRHAASGGVATQDPDRAALAFMSMVIGAPARIIVAGSAIAPAELEARIRFSVRLFLNGVRPRTGEDGSD
jgi:TetR/AcrR family transcriptional regulator, mexJK operon transcriptional repressor